MKQTSFSRLFLIGLSAYLLRLEMSVDRALRQGIGPLKDYCEGATIPTLRQVLNKLASMSAVDGTNKPMREDASVLLNGFLLKFIAWLGWYLRGSVVFKEREVMFIYSALFQLSTELDRCQTVDPKVFVPIRLRLLEASSLCITRIPDRGVRGRIYRVEHLNQNIMLKRETIDSICGHQDWLMSASSGKTGGLR